MKGLSDYRDNRGKWHSLTFFIVTVVFAMLVGRSKVFSIHRYMTHKIVWLREVTGIKDAPLVSRAHFPRMLENLDWQDLNQLINAFFDEKTAHIIANEWVAIDGKIMRGTLKSGEKQAIIVSTLNFRVKQISDLQTLRFLSDKIRHRRHFEFTTNSVINIIIKTHG
ncbi:MAG: transposase family protein [Methylococcales bacterium]|nr:transposase family protein [Methylococcales bacterium]